MKEIQVLNTNISIIEINDNDYICLTDMTKGKDKNFFISNWLRNRNTLEYIGIWEQLYNKNFNYVEFDIIKNQSGLNGFRISVKDFIKKTNAISIIAKTGRYGGTYAHKDLAFEFGMWISPKFKIYLVKEFQRLKELEHKNNEWDIKREIAKINYSIHTTAIKENLIVPELTKDRINFIYSCEADILNVALFGMTASEWKKEHKDLKGNIRDYASIEHLLVLANMESYNSILIKEGLSQKERIIKLHEMAKSQIKVLQNNNYKLLTNQ